MLTIMIGHLVNLEPHSKHKVKGTLLGNPWHIVFNRLECMSEGMRHPEVLSYDTPKHRRITALNTTLTQCLEHHGVKRIFCVCVG